MKHEIHHSVIVIMHTYTVPKQIYISHLVSGIFQRGFPCQSTQPKPIMPQVLRGWARSHPNLAFNRDSKTETLLQHIFMSNDQILIKTCFSQNFYDWLWSDIKTTGCSCPCSLFPLIQIWFYCSQEVPNGFLRRYKKLCLVLEQKHAEGIEECSFPPGF